MKFIMAILGLLTVVSIGLEANGPITTPKTAESAIETTTTEKTAPSVTSGSTISLETTTSAPSTSTSTVAPHRALSVKTPVLAKKTVTVTTKKPVVTQNAGSCGQYAPMLSAVGLPVSTFLFIMHRESRCDPSAVGTQGDSGLLQIHPINKAYLENLGLHWWNRFDPWTNIRMAKALYVYWCHAGNCMEPWQ